jgi:apolipoprotein N-acyltransferase
MYQEKSGFRQSAGLWPWVWLAVGTFLAAFSNGNHAVPIAAWLFPAFFIRFLRSQSYLYGLPVGFIALCLACTVVVWPMLSIELLEPRTRLAAGIIWSVRVFVPFLADRVLAPRFKGLVSTLVFPTAWTTVELLYSFMPDGTWGALAYTQYFNLSFIQLASITGICGICFLTTWSASVANWVWEERFDWNTVRSGVLIYGSVLLAVMLWGGLRLAWEPYQSGTVCVAAVTKTKPFSSLFDARSSRELVCRSSKEEQEHFLRRIVSAARSGAGIIAWQEHAVFLREEDELVFVRRCRDIAAAEKIYLIMAYAVFPHDFPTRHWRNKLTGIDTTGQVVWEYLKSYPSVALEPGLPPGDRRVPILNTVYGKVAAIICTDQEHPDLVRQVGQAGAFLLVVPSAGWEGVTPLHAHMATFRAIENGCSIVKPNGNGLTAAFDPRGRVVSTLDWRAAGHNVMMAYVSDRAEATIYPRVGDLVGWLSMVAFGSFIVSAVLRRP